MLFIKTVVGLLFTWPGWYAVCLVDVSTRVPHVCDCKIIVLHRSKIVCTCLYVYWIVIVVSCRCYRHRWPWSAGEEIRRSRDNIENHICCRRTRRDHRPGRHQRLHRRVRWVGPIDTDGPWFWTQIMRFKLNVFKFKNYMLFTFVSNTPNIESE